MRLFEDSIVVGKEEDYILVQDKAYELGLHTIDFDVLYKLTKMGAKVDSAMGYPDQMVALEKGKISVIGVVQDTEVLVWIALTWINGEWFKTSPIVKFEKVSDTEYSIETENSFYKLEQR